MRDRLAARGGTSVVHHGIGGEVRESYDQSLGRILNDEGAYGVSRQIGGRPSRHNQPRTEGRRLKFDSILLEPVTDLSFALPAGLHDKNGAPVVPREKRLGVFRAESRYPTGDEPVGVGVTGGQVGQDGRGGRVGQGGRDFPVLGPGFPASPALRSTAFTNPAAFAPATSRARSTDVLTAA